MERSDSVRHEAEGLIVEYCIVEFLSDAIKRDKEVKNFQLIKLMDDGKQGRRLNIDLLEKSLKGFGKKKELINLIKKINSEKKPLPDFLFVIHAEDIDVLFIEAKKKGMKFKYSNLPQKHAINDLGEAGYNSLIIRLKLDLPVREDPEVFRKIIRRFKQDSEEEFEEKIVKVTHIKEKKLKEFVVLIELKFQRVCNKCHKYLCNWTGKTTCEDCSKEQRNKDKE